MNFAGLTDASQVTSYKMSISHALVHTTAVLKFGSQKAPQNFSSGPPLLLRPPLVRGMLPRKNFKNLHVVLAILMLF